LGLEALLVSLRTLKFHIHGGCQKKYQVEQGKFVETTMFGRLAMGVIAHSKGQIGSNVVIQKEKLLKELVAAANSSFL
jgi:hypothetical protein